MIAIFYYYDYDYDYDYYDYYDYDYYSYYDYDYKRILWSISRDEALNRLNNFVLEDKDVL